MAACTSLVGQRGEKEKNQIKIKTEWMSIKTIERFFDGKISSV